MHFNLNFSEISIAIVSVAHTMAYGTEDIDDLDARAVLSQISLIAKLKHHYDEMMIAPPEELRKAQELVSDAIKKAKALAGGVVMSEDSFKTFEIELSEHERDIIEGSLSYSASFYTVFQYVDSANVLSLCDKIGMDEDCLRDIKEYFDKERADMVKLRGEEWVLSVESRFGKEAHEE